MSFWIYPPLILSCAYMNEKQMIPYPFKILAHGIFLSFLGCDYIIHDEIRFVKQNLFVIFNKLFDLYSSFCIKDVAASPIFS